MKGGRARETSTLPNPRRTSPLSASTSSSFPYGLSRVEERGEPSHAPTFFSGLTVQSGRGRSTSLNGQAIGPPTYEEGASAGQRPIAGVDKRPYERIVEAWIVALRRAPPEGVDVLHLHHLTPIHEGALRAFADVRSSRTCTERNSLCSSGSSAAPVPPLQYTRARVARMRQWQRRRARVIGPRLHSWSASTADVPGHASGAQRALRSAELAA